MTKKLTRLWCTPKFKKFVYSKKANNPEKDLIDILDDIADEKNERGKKRNETFWGKI